jgi:uncharacterized protein involved in exopolysaccharide biosynthesis
MNVFEEERVHSSVLTMYFRYWKLIAVTVLLCSVLAFVATIFMKERYRAKASFFIPYDISLEKTVDDPKLGYDTEADRMLQILNSEKLKDSVVRKFDLIKYFKIDTSEYIWPQKLTNKYRQRIFANRTNIMSIIIEAETYDPKFSASIVNYIVECSGRMRQEMYRGNTRLAEEAFRKEFVAKQQVVDSLARMIGDLRKDEHGNYPLLENLVINGNSSSSSTQKEILTQRFIYENSQLNEMRLKYETARNTSVRPIPGFYNIDPAYPIYEPSFPLRGFNIAIGFFGSLFMILAILYGRYVVLKFRKPE